MAKRSIRICPKCEAIAKPYAAGLYRCTRESCNHSGLYRQFPTLISQTTNPTRANKGMGRGCYHKRPHIGN